VVRDARYDRFADWYPGRVGDGNGFIADSAGDLLPASVQGARVLDVACGHGRASRALARLGADVVGVDISAELVAGCSNRASIARSRRVGGVRDRPPSRTTTYWRPGTFARSGLT
jgi:2-polyprenyl-3-methyl-5-hydroxy-6-metoxy-1,4-benzoquinol methylase